jgi:hypothetical protein
VVEGISACVEAHSLMGPLGPRDLVPGAPGALLASPTPVEFVSGAEEGAVVLPGCSLDRHGLLAHGDWVEACQGSPHGRGSYDPDGSRGAIEGLLQGHDVWRRVAAAACGGRAGPATLCWCTPLQATPPPTRGITGQGEPPRPCTCKQRGRSVGGLRVRRWSRPRARWPG